jgi:hypothetical protein
LQIIFEAVDTTKNPKLLERYPMGVKVTQRAYSKDEVVLLKRLPTSDDVSENLLQKNNFKEIEKAVLDDIQDGKLIFYQLKLVYILRIL